MFDLTPLLVRILPADPALAGAYTICILALLVMLAALRVAILLLKRRGRH